jgi:tRNA(adenine34) deaminase
MDHVQYMQLALEQARRAYAAGNRPVGSVIVRDGAVISHGLNTVAADRDPSAHAEIAALRAACRQLDTLTLPAATLYTTLEPCPMCLWAILETRVSRLVMGARHAALGRTDIGDYTVERFLGWTKRPLEIVTGVLEAECVELRLKWMREQQAR